MTQVDTDFIFYINYVIFIVFHQDLYLVLCQKWSLYEITITEKIEQFFQGIKNYTVDEAPWKYIHP